MLQTLSFTSMFRFQRKRLNKTNHWTVLELAFAVSMLEQLGSSKHKTQIRQNISFQVFWKYNKSAQQIASLSDLLPSLSNG